MRRILMTALLTAGVMTTFAQSKKDEQSIKSLCGCYDIEFKYAETFASDTNYKLAKPYIAHGREWVEPVEEAPGKFSFQHLLVINDTTIIKHWREDWKYQNTELLAFEKSGAWKKVTLPASAVKGQWTQTVWEVDDAPRYQGTASWVYADGKTYWENNTDAPLPRREYSIRSDYNVLNRNNRIWITNDGWSHEQDNKKVLRKDGSTDQVLVQEKGYNIYHKVADSKCTAAKKFWEKNKDQWIAVRKKWDDKIKTADGEFKL